MSIKEDFKLVLTELSPILAGFKLAVIVIGYFGLGSVAKWIISYWYPFTRWAWDQVAIKLSLPELPLIVKDSLTALVFFLPLGVTAVIQKIRGEHGKDGRHRVSSALFGFLFLIIICKDVIESIVNSISLSFQEFDFEPILKIDNVFNNSLDGSFTIFLSFYTILIVIYLIMRLLSRKHSKEDGSFFGRFLEFEDRAKKALLKYNRLAFKISSAFSVFVFAIFGFYVVVTNGSEDPVAIVGAFFILAIIVISLLLAIFYAPKKLFITTGAAIAFVLAALLFEGFITAKSFMESVPNG